MAALKARKRPKALKAKVPAKRNKPRVFQQELQALQSIQQIDPVVEKVEKVYKDIDQVYEKFIRKIKKTNDIEKLNECFRTLLMYKRSLSSDPLIFLKIIKTLNPDQVEIAKSVARKARLMREISKDKDPRLLFGKK